MDRLIFLVWGIAESAERKRVHSRAYDKALSEARQKGISDEPAPPFTKVMFTSKLYIEPVCIAAVCPHMICVVHLGAVGRSKPVRWRRRRARKRRGSCDRVLRMV